MIIYSFRFTGLLMYSCWSKGNAVNILVEISVMITYKLAWQNWSVQFIEILTFLTRMYIYIHKVGGLYICYLCVWAYMDTAMIHILILNTGNKVEECKGWHFLFMFHLKLMGGWAWIFLLVCIYPQSILKRQLPFISTLNVSGALKWNHWLMLLQKPPVIFNSGN